MDGEYIKNLGVGLHLMRNENCLNIPQSTHSWYSWDWDKSHLLELAYADANKGTIAAVDQTIHTIDGIFTRSPKAFTDLKSQAEEFGKDGSKLLVPLQKSETRYLRHQHDVLSHFLNNYPSIYDFLEKDDNLNRMNNVPFILRTAYTADVLNVLQTVSPKSQTVGLLSWRLYDYIDDGLITLNAKNNSISNNNFENLHHGLKNFKSVLDELGDGDG